MKEQEMREKEEMLENMDSLPPKNRKRCIIYSDNIYRNVWEILVMVLLIFVCIIIPLRIAIKEVNTDAWKWILRFCDFLFLIDLVA